MRIFDWLFYITDFDFLEDLQEWKPEKRRWKVIKYVLLVICLSIIVIGLLWLFKFFFEDLIPSSAIEGFKLLACIIIALVACFLYLLIITLMLEWFEGFDSRVKKLSSFVRVFLYIGAIATILVIFKVAVYLVDMLRV